MVLFLYIPRLSDIVICRKNNSRVFNFNQTYVVDTLEHFGVTQFRNLFNVQCFGTVYDLLSHCQMIEKKVHKNNSSMKLKRLIKVRQKFKQFVAYLIQMLLRAQRVKELLVEDCI